MKTKHLDELSAEELKEGLGKILEEMNRNNQREMINDVCYIMYKDLLQKKGAWNKEYENLYKKAKGGILKR